MSDEQERHLPASQRRLDEAREEGNVPRSRELGAALVLLAAAALVQSTGGEAARRFLGLLESGLTFDRVALLQPAAMGERLLSTGSAGLWLALPGLGLLTLAGIGAQLALGGWNFSWKAISPDFTRMSPVRGLGQLFSWHGAGELGKALLKAGLIGGVAAYLIHDSMTEYAQLLAESSRAAVFHLGVVVARDFLILCSLLILVAALDVPFQWWRYHANLRMTAEEVRREHRESDGDPHLKARIRSQQREAARSRMMSEVPKADVVITNPTHFAVALAYQEQGMRAPRVVAKGTDLVAARIRELAEEHGVPRVEAPPLARALYRHAEIGDDIPQPLYGAVAQVLAYVFQLKRWVPGRGAYPTAPRDIDVPVELQVAGEAA